MTDLIVKLVTDHGLAAVLGLASIAIQVWMARWVFANLAGINASMRELRDQLPGVSALPPPKHRRRRGVTNLLPRAPTPLPFWPVPQPDEDKEG